MATSLTEVHPHKTVSHAEWIEARKQLLAREKEFTRLRDELSLERRQLPWERIGKPYTFEGPRGKLTLADLFDGRSQLIVYHFMFGPGWSEGCPSCSYLADHFDGTTIHLAHRDVTLAVVSRAPYTEIAAFKNRMGWRFHWVSSFASDFNYDFQVTQTEQEKASGIADYNYSLGPLPIEERPGASVFSKEANGEIFHTYSTYARGLDILVGTYNLLDMAPRGRGEDQLKFSMAWVRHHDKYDHNYFLDSERGYEQPAKLESAGGHSCCSGDHHG